MNMTMIQYQYVCVYTHIHVNPAQNTRENVMGLMVLMGIVLVLMDTIMVSTGMWWILLVGL